LTVLALAASRAHADPVMYTVTNLGSRYGAALNNLGDVVGNDAGMVFPVGGTPYIYQSYGPAAGAFIDLSGQVGTAARLTGINDAGQISGTIETPGDYHGFIDTAGRVSMVLAPPEAPQSVVTGINNSGAIVGTNIGTYSGPPPAPGGGFLDAHGQLINLGSALDPAAISGSGIVVGTAASGSAFIYQDGKTTYIPGNAGEAMGVNDAGQVVGQYVASSVPTSNGSSAAGWHAFLYQDGRFTDLGTLKGGLLSGAAAINVHGQIVGTSSDTTSLYGSSHAFLYQNGKMTDLNDLISSSSGWTLQAARAINDKGQILGWGIGPSGEQDTFLLTPLSEPPPIAPQIPEPSTLAFFALVGAGNAIRRACRRLRS
jgi:probable HAF family extracellular repeat protein